MKHNALSHACIFLHKFQTYYVKLLKYHAVTFTKYTNNVIVFIKTAWRKCLYRVKGLLTTLFGKLNESSWTIYTISPLQIVWESLPSRASPYKGSLNVNILAAKPNTFLVPVVIDAGRYMLTSKFLKKIKQGCMSPKWNNTVSSTIFSSPEHEVLMVSYCGQWSVVVRRPSSCDVRRASCVVRRASSVNIWC